MKLIADSGSTKTDWVLINNKETTQIKTKGLNPVFSDTEFITNEIENSDLVKYKNDINKIFFYGAGCSSKERNAKIETALKNIFKKSKISVNNDLIAAGIALFGKSKGIAVILGTGTNTGIYQNNKIKENIKSLGYILGDEGSGAYIGKMFIKAFLENELPENINTELENEFSVNRDVIIKKVYTEAFANKYLASFMPFIHKHKQNKFIYNMLEKAFSDFFEKTIFKYKNYKQYDLKITGSIAFYFSDILNDTAKKYNIEIKEILKSPIENLVEFYKNNY